MCIDFQHDAQNFFFNLNCKQKKTALPFWVSTWFHSLWWQNSGQGAQSWALHRTPNFLHCHHVFSSSNYNKSFKSVQVYKLPTGRVLLAILSWQLERNTSWPCFMLSVFSKWAHTGWSQIGQKDLVKNWRGEGIWGNGCHQMAGKTKWPLNRQ